MLVLRSIVIILGGLAFMFLPGAVIGLLIRRGYRYDRSLLLWGMGVLILALLPASYLTTLLRLILWPEAELSLAARYLLALLSSVLTAFFLEGAKYLVLRRRKLSQEELPSGGVMIGLGVGLLNKVFLGFVLVGAGIRLLLGSSVGQGLNTELGPIAVQPWPSLILNLLALITDRMAVILVSSALGVLVARAIIERQLRWLWVAVAASAAFSWIYAAIDLGLGLENLSASLIVILYEGALAFLVLRWLVGQAPSQDTASLSQSKGRASPRVT